MVNFLNCKAKLKVIEIDGSAEILIRSKTVEMAVHEKQIKLIALKMDMLEEEKIRLFSAVEAYVSGVKFLGHSFEDCQNDEDWSFTVVSQATERALTIMTKEAGMFRMLDTEKIINPIGTQVNTEKVYDSPSLSFEVLSHCPSRSLMDNRSAIQMSRGHAVDRMDILERELKTHTSKTDSLASSMPSILEELRNLKKQVATIAAVEAPSDGSVSQAKHDDRIMDLGKSLSTAKTHFEETFKNHESLMKEFSTSFAKIEECLNKFEANLNVLENQGKTVDLRSRDLEKRLNALEENDHRMDSEIKIIESRSSSTDSKLKEFNQRLGHSQELIRTVICDRDRGRLAMIEQLQETLKNLQIIRRECNKRTEKNDADIANLLLRLSVIEEREEKQMSSDPRIIHHLNPVANSKNELSVPQPVKVKESSCQGPQLAMLMKVGARVRRGPDWSCGDVDGPAPGLGTVTSTDRLQYGLVFVKWDNGHKDLYHMGLNDLYQLQLADVT